MAWLGQARQGKAGQGKAWQGKARKAKALILLLKVNNPKQ